MTPEGYVKKAVEDLLKAEHIRYWRMNAGDIFGRNKGKPWRIRGHGRGTPDILAAVPQWLNVNDGEYFKTFTSMFWIECKAPGKSPSEDQLQFADEARNNGEYWLLVDDVKILQDWLKENRAR